jgi:hypothetical protein
MIGHQWESRLHMALLAIVCRLRTAIQPFGVIRGRPRSVFARNPRSHSRSTTAEGGQRFLKNAKFLKKLRSPRCKLRSTHERINDRCNNFAPTQATALTQLGE